MSPKRKKQAKKARKPARKAVVKKLRVRKTRLTPRKPAPKPAAQHARKGGALSRIEEYLASQKVRYQLIRHPKAYTAQEIAAAEHISGKQHVKVVVVEAQGQHFLAALPATARVDFKKLGAAIGRSVCLSKESALQTLFPDCDVGAMPPLGSLYHLPVFVDKALAEQPEIVIQAGTHTDAIKLAYADFVRLESPKVADFGLSIGGH